MQDNPRICDLLVRWEEAKARGTPLTPEELCGEQVDLVEPLRYRIAKLEAFDRVLEGPRGMTSHSTFDGPKPPQPTTTDQFVWQPPGFEILGELGRGGMGVVFRARQLNLDRVVALKTIPATSVAGPRALARFDLEARTVARLRHPQIVQIYEVGSHDNCPYIALECMEGGSLSDLIDDAPLDYRLAARVAETLARATHFAHLLGIIHRDLKPSNVLLAQPCTTDDLDTSHLKISDFGLAKLLGEGNTSHLTKSGTTLGTPSYMAPEQAQGKADAIGPATDVYGLGAVLYEMLCGRPPFQAHSDWLTIHQVVTSPPRPVRESRPDCPPALEAICLRCLSKDPARRYPTAEALADDLDRFLRGMPTAGHRDGLRSRRVWLAGAGLAAASAFGAAAAYCGQRRGSTVPVGVLQSQSEFMAETGRAVINATLFAIGEVNASGGVLGRVLVPFVADGQSDEQVFVHEARRLLEEAEVNVLFACLTTTHRRAVEPVVERSGRLLFYPGESEGLQQSRNVVALGPVPNQNIFPAVGWCRDVLGKRRFYLVGNDAVYPHAVAAILGDAAGSLSVELVGESYTSRTDVISSIVDAVEAVEAERPDVILNLMQGQANLAFIHMLRDRKLTSARYPTMSFCFSEHDLPGVLNAMVGDYLCGHYFQDVATPENAEFLRRVHRDSRLAATPVVSDAMVAAYVGVHAWARAVARARTFDDAAAIRRALPSIRLAGPGGDVRMDPVAQADAKVARIARVGRDRKLAIEWTSPTTIRPNLYPATRTPGEWDELLRALQARWGGHWSNREPSASTPFD